MKLYAEISKTESQDDGTIKVWGYASSEAIDSGRRDGYSRGHEGRHPRLYEMGRRARDAPAIRRRNRHRMPR